MSSTVAQIGNAAAEIVGLPRQTTYVGNTNQNAIKILRAVKDAARDAGRDFDWVVLRREHTFVTDASSSYALPTYFERIVNGTIWDRTNYRQLIGPMTSTEWQKWKSGSVSGSSIDKLIRIYSTTSGVKNIEIYPSTDTGNTIAFEYIDSRNVKSSVGDLQEDIVADTDVFLFDDEVVEAGTVWRLLRMLGLSYGDEKAEYMALIDERRAKDVGAPVLDLQLSKVYMGFDPHVPDRGFGS